MGLCFPKFCVYDLLHKLWGWQGGSLSGGGGAWRESEKGLAVVGCMAGGHTTDFYGTSRGCGFAQTCFDNTQGKNRQTMANPAFG